MTVPPRHSQSTEKKSWRKSVGSFRKSANKPPKHGVKNAKNRVMRSRNAPIARKDQARDRSHPPVEAISARHAAPSGRHGRLNRLKSQPFGNANARTAPARAQGLCKNRTNSYAKHTQV